MLAQKARRISTLTAESLEQNTDLNKGAHQFLSNRVVVLHLVKMVGAALTCTNYDRIQI